MFLATDMKNEIIEDYLKIKHRSFDERILDLIQSGLSNAQSNNDNDEANYYWYLMQVFLVQKNFILAFEYLLSEKYEESWNILDNIDIDIGYINRNVPSGYDTESFNLDFIGRIIKEYQKLFPYRHFFSRESIIKEEKCSICGNIIKIRNHCPHIPGKIYMGRLCLREVTNMELKAMAIVTDPFDKYALLHPEGKEYNYGMLKYLLEVIKEPYTDFHVKIQKEKKKEYEKVGRNDLCPCGSGKKYKKCHLGTNDELYDHYVVCTQGTQNQSNLEVKTFNTWL